MIYRPEIDGLRAISVLSVIFFHANFGIVNGGFIGVDVFFVISGYLITSILIDEIEKGNFSLINFYERRARRILPALFFILLCCIPFAWIWMLPSQLKDFSQSLIAVVFFVSNFLFWIEDGYFAPSAELKPLLHTWSLAVEEQYYLLFPLFLSGFWRFGSKRVFWMIAVMAMLSLGASELGWRYKPSDNFYLAPTRAWEILIGSLCAFWLHDHQQKASNALSSIGLFTLILVFIFYNDEIPFPSIYTLLPVICTLLIIIYGQSGTWVAKILSIKYLVGIGLISYSAYLWHQPIFAFARIRSIFEPSPPLMAALVFLSLVLAYVTWICVEKPFRGSKPLCLSKQKNLLIAVALFGSLFTTLGAIGIAFEGFPNRLPQKVLLYESAKNDFSTNDCHLDDNNRFDELYNSRCTKAINNKIDLMFIGDSHMRALTKILRYELDKKGYGYRFLSKTSCIPLPGFQLFDGSLIYNCDDYVLYSLNWANKNKVKTLVLSARFPLYLQGQRFNNGEGGIESGSCSFVDVSSYPRAKCQDIARKQRVLNEYEIQIRKLAKHFNIVLVYPIPEAGWNVPIYAFKNAYFNGDSKNISTSYQIYKDRAGDIIKLFDKLVIELNNVKAARIDKVLCNDKSNRCLNTNGDDVYYYDDDHLSNTGARLVAPAIISAIDSFDDMGGETEFTNATKKRDAYAMTH